jgi:hypothetical protein
VYDNTARREAVQLAIVTLVSTFSFTVGAVALSLGEGFTIGAAPAVGVMSNSSITGAMATAMKTYNSLEGYSLDLTIIGVIMMVGGFALGIGYFLVVHRRIRRHEHQR